MIKKKCMNKNRRWCNFISACTRVLKKLLIFGRFSVHSTLISLYSLQSNNMKYHWLCTSNKLSNLQAKFAQQHFKQHNHLPNPLCTLVLGTALCRNYWLLLSKISCWLEMMDTPSSSFLVRGSKWVDTTSSSFPWWYREVWRTMVLVLSPFTRSTWWPRPLVKAL